MFLKNDRELGVKNGTLATIEQAGNERLIARIDGGERIRIDQETYAHIDHGYAVTLHKAQGATVDRAFVLASGGMDRHLIYVGMTRHRDDAALYAGYDDFRDEGAMMRRLGRARPKISTLDFAERRGFETEKPALANARGWIERGRAYLAEIWAHAELGLAAVRERFAGLGREVEAEAVPPAEQVRPAQVRPAQVRDQGGSLRAPPPAAEDAVAAGRRSEGLLSEQAIASGRAAFRERYEAHKRQQAAEAARDAQARSLVRQWGQLTEAYLKALPDLEHEPSLWGTRVKLAALPMSCRIIRMPFRLCGRKGRPTGSPNSRPWRRCWLTGSRSA